MMEETVMLVLCIKRRCYLPADLYFTFIEFLYYSHQYPYLKTRLYNKCLADLPKLCVRPGRQIVYNYFDWWMDGWMAQQWLPKEDPLQVHLLYSLFCLFLLVIINIRLQKQHRTASRHSRLRVRHSSYLIRGTTCPRTGMPCRRGVA